MHFLGSQRRVGTLLRHLHPGYVRKSTQNSIHNWSLFQINSTHVEIDVFNAVLPIPRCTIANRWIHYFQKNSCELQWINLTKWIAGSVYKHSQIATLRWFFFSIFGCSCSRDLLSWILGATRGLIRHKKKPYGTWDLSKECIISQHCLYFQLKFNDKGELSISGFRVYIYLQLFITYSIHLARDLWARVILHSVHALQILRNQAHQKLILRTSINMYLHPIH